MHKDLVRLALSERAVRNHLAVCLAAAVLTGLLVLVQAELLAGVLSGRFATSALILLAVVVGVRALFALAQGVAAGRMTTGVKSALRHRLLARLRDLGPVRPASQRSGELVTLTGRGLDALDPYLSGYLPAVAVAGVVPIAVLVRLFTADLASAVIVLVTLPLIPIFGALVGMHTKAVTERQWRALSRLGGHFLDVVRGLPTLRAFGRARHQAEVIRRVADAHRAATMRTLRVAFLSSLVLELAASLSLALVAVPVGLRLLSGSLDLSAALLVLLLAPEAYLPLRNMGGRFHAAMEGVAAADEAFGVLDGQAKTAGTAKTGTETAGTETAGTETAGTETAGTETAGTETAGAAKTEARPPHDEHAGPRTAAGSTPGQGAGPDGAPEIRLEHVTVRYPDREEAALEDVSLVIAPGERVALVGESGAGKSTLLHLLLGFVTPSEGRVLVDGVEIGDHDSWRARLAFVPQRPHLFATSVADNIGLGAPGATIGEIRAAARAAQADEFVTALPEGYDTVLGERGTNLSAGQRQRVALARAFCRPDAGLLLLDEPTARLDGRSEGAIVSATRDLAEGRTAVIVAHRPAMIDLADRVIRIADGRVVTEEGTGRDARGDLLVTGVNGIPAGRTDSRPADRVDGRLADHTGERPADPADPADGPSTNHTDERPASRTEEGPASRADERSAGRAEERSAGRAEEQSAGRTGGRLVLAAAGAAAAELAGLGLIGSAAWLITRAAEQPPLAALSVAIVGVRAFATTKGIFRYGERLSGHDVALRAQATTRERLYQALIPTASSNRRGADLLSRMVDDTDAVQDLLVRCLLPAVAALVTGVAAVVIGLFLLPAAALALLAGLLVAGVLIPAGTAAAARRWSARIAPARADLAARVADLVHGAADLTAYGADERALAAAAETDARLAALERRQARANAVASALGLLTQGLTVVAVVLLASAAGAGSVVTAVLALVSLVSFEPVLPMAAAGERLTGVLAALRRLREVGATPPAVSEPAVPVAVPAGPPTVEIEDLVVRHGTGLPPALDGVSLTLTPGRRVALVGPSGAGKSTLLSALMRLVEPESGTIRVSGVDIRELASDDARQVMTGLTQDPYVFQTSVRDNLRLAGPEAGDEELAEAMRRARLDRWVERTGWDAVLGEDGRTVSGGQLQRLALARALLHDPPVLLLDEPAEALDETTADALMADLLDATHGRTTLLVTHRLRGLEPMDEILVLENGSVTQRGTHRELVSSPGYYRDLWRSEALTAGR